MNFGRPTPFPRDEDEISPEIGGQDQIEADIMHFDEEEQRLISDIMTVVPGTVADPAEVEPEQRADGTLPEDMPSAEAKSRAESGEEKKETEELQKDFLSALAMDEVEVSSVLSDLIDAAGEMGEIDMVSRILATEKVDINECSYMGRNALHEAARCGHPDIVKLLLDSRADIEAHITQDFGRFGLKTAADLAAYCGCLHAFKVLREYNASVSAVTLTCLLRGEGPRYTEAVEALLSEAKAQPGQARLREHLRVLLLPSCDLENDFPAGAAAAAASGALNEQNLFEAAEVGVTVLGMPLLAPVARARMVLAAVAETANEESVATDTVDALISAAWLQMRASTAADILLMLVSVVCLCRVSYAYRYGGIDAMPALWTLTLIHSKEALEWLAQAASLFWSQCCGSRKSEDSALGLESLADLLYLVLGYLSIWSQMEQEELDQSFMPVFSAMSWLRLLYSLRGERWLGPRLLPILSAVRDTWSFFLVTVLCLASATHAYFILNPRGEDPLPIYSAFTHTVRLGIFGDFDLFEYQGQDTTFAVDATGEWVPNDPVPEEIGSFSFVYLQVIFFVTGVGITILLMNLLIGVLGQNYEIHTDRAQVLFVRARARMLLEHRSRPQAQLQRLHRRLLKGRKTKTKSTSEPRDEAEEEVREEEAQEEESFPRSEMGTCHFCMAVTVLLCFLPIMFTVIGSRHWDAVLGPVRRIVFQYSTLTCLLFLIFPVLLAVSMLVALPVALGLGSFWLLGFRIEGMQYAMNLTLFRVFGNEPAPKCTIYAVVRTESGVDELRGMRTDLKDKMQKLEEVLQKQDKAHKESLAEQKESMRNVQQKMDKILMLLAGQPNPSAAPPEG
ncbi:Cttnbp2 [Symbiodinium sp. CCMP2592]|nr:Cttnbp2 [Symbiodinium sp. CCMP2592]